MKLSFNDNELRPLLLSAALASGSALVSVDGTKLVAPTFQVVDFGINGFDC